MILRQREKPFWAERRAMRAGSRSGKKSRLFEKEMSGWVGEKERPSLHSQLATEQVCLTSLNVQTRQARHERRFQCPKTESTNSPCVRRYVSIGKGLLKSRVRASDGRRGDWRGRARLGTGGVRRSGKWAST